MIQRTPMKRSAWKRQPGPAKGPGLAQRIAEPLGRAIKHVHSEPSMFRSRAHRMTVADLPCANCGRVGRSQAAHLNGQIFGKGLGIKSSDAFLIPLCCDEIGRRGCHMMLDQGGVYDRATSAALQLKWLHETRDKLIRCHKWPLGAQLDVDRLLSGYSGRAA